MPESPPFSLDFATPERVADPYPLYRRLLTEAPVAWHEGLSGWLISPYDLATRLFLDPRLSADRLGPAYERLPAEQQRASAPLFGMLRRWALLLDPPDHTRLRTMLAKSFTPRLIRDLEPKIQSVVDRLLRRPLVEGRLDAVRDLAYPLPTMVIALLLGLPVEDGDQLKSWSDEIALFLGRAMFGGADLKRARDAVVEMSDYFRQHIAHCRRSPGDDLTTRLIEARRQGQVRDDRELVATCIMLLFAGHETTSNVIVNALWCLLRFPGEEQRLRQDPSLLGSAVEEAMRFETPVPRPGRAVARPIELGGHCLEPGHRVVLLAAAANRDPAQFPEPDHFDIGRHPNRHLGFGWGSHYCIGASLGRLEVKLALGTLLARTARMNTQVGEPRWSPIPAIRRLEELPVEIEAA